MIPPCFLGLCLQDSSIDVLKFGFRGKESHLFLFSVADSAAVQSGKRCAESNSTPASCEESSSPRSYYRAQQSFDSATRYNSNTRNTYLVLQFLILCVHFSNVLLHLPKLSFFLESTFLCGLPVLYEPMVKQRLIGLFREIGILSFRIQIFSLSHTNLQMIRESKLLILTYT